MKTLKNMTELEILALSDSQVEKILKYRKAEEWIALIEKPEEPSYEETPKKDITFYSVSVLDRILFKSSDVAWSIAEFINSKVDEDTYISSYWSSPKRIASLSSYEKDYANATVLSKNHYSPELCESAKQIEKRNEEKRKTYESYLEKYEIYVEEIQWLVDEVWDRVFEVRRKYTNLKKLQNDYSEYIILADKNEEIATKFLTKANSLTEEEIKIIKWKKIDIKHINIW